MRKSILIGVPPAGASRQCQGAEHHGRDVSEGAGRVSRSSAHPFMWFSMAAARGDARAKTELREVSREMTSAEIAKAREMMQACEVSNYRDCAH
jgi:hypothetical protein